MSIPPGCHANLERLCQELQDHAGRLGVSSGPSPQAAKLSGGLFLAHSTAERTFAKVCAARRLSSAGFLAKAGVRPLPPDCAEAVLGTSDAVFFYVAPFRYPNTGCGLLFAPTLEVEVRASGVSTPFDSGGLLTKVTRKDPEEEVRAFLARHELPIPDHRRYLGQVMTTLFEQPKHYVEGKEPRWPSPVGLSGGDQRRWTHEVRIPDQVAVQGPHLQAVFAPRARVARDQGIRALLKWCRQERVDRVTFESAREDDFEVLQRECIKYIRRALY